MQRDPCSPLWTLCVPLFMCVYSLVGLLLFLLLKFKYFYYNYYFYQIY